MPTLHWIGKEKIINHHLDVPFKILERQYNYNSEQNSDNKIIHGDNLEALKSLLPEYEDKIKCIYIDPPYNTGKEGWVYNDNVNNPKIREWLGKVVGKESEDFTRHDKWLCMMYPRLKLLHRLLAKDGVIFISIDDNEYHYLKTILDEIFGSKNHLTTFIWRTDGNFDNQAKIKINHEYIVCYSKEIGHFGFPEVVDPNIEDSSKLFKDSVINTIIKNGSKNPLSKINLPTGFPANFENGILEKRNDSYPYYYNDGVIVNYKLNNDIIIESGWSSKNILELFIENGFNAVLDTKGQLTSFYLTKKGAIESIKKRDIQSHVISSLMNMGSTQNMSNELKSMGITFDYPKPTLLIKYLISLINDKNCIVLDSFAGSGTTAEAIIKLNKEDGGNRKFILIEMEDYANTITAERVKRTISGFRKDNKTTKGLGGNFSFFSLGEPLFLPDGMLNEKVNIENIRQYIWYSETTLPYSRNLNITHPYLLGCWQDTGYYFYYEKDKLTTLNHEFLDKITQRNCTYVIYADNCVLSKEFLDKTNIVFKKIPRDISRF